MRDKYLSVNVKYGKCRVVCGTQNCLRTHAKVLTEFRACEERIYVYNTWIRRKKTLGVFSWYTKRHKTE